MGRRTTTRITLWRLIEILKSPRLRRFLTRGALIVAALGLLAFTILWVASPVDQVDFIRTDDAFTVVDRKGAALRHVRSEGIDRRWVEFDQISPHMIDAVLAVEDNRFREHSGVDFPALLRAALSFLLPGRRFSGASTISQQVIKLIYGRAHGLWSKPSEIVRAIRLERLLTKDEILEQYLNRLPYGDQIEGIARASEEYFGHPPSELTVSEAAMLAGIPQAPSVTEPRRHRHRALERRRFVLHRMRATGRIDEATYRSALAERPIIRSEQPRPWRAPRFVDAAYEQWRQGRLDRNGRLLHTSLDLQLQRQVETVMERAVDQHTSRGVENGAAFVLANATGEVLAYVGAARSGPEHPAGEMDLLRAARQPGSTLKPFVYELLFERGGTAATVLDDMARPMTGAGDTIFEAQDYDGHERGPVRARVALSSSLNLAALDAARRVGPHRIVARLRALGVERLENPDHYGAAIVLGGADVTPIELATAYLAIARGGTRLPTSFAPGGDDVEPAQVMDRTAAAVVADILSDPSARADAFGDDLTFIFDDELFGLKTGTSSGWHDAWAAVFTDLFTVVVWLGDPTGRPLGGVSGFEGAAQPAVRILAAAHERAVDLHVELPEVEAPTFTVAQICAASGLLAGDRCVHTQEERFGEGTLPSGRCRAHREDGTWMLPHRYARWLRQSSPAGVALRSSLAVADEAQPRIVHPVNGSRWLLDASRGQTQVPLRAEIAGASPPDIEWEVDGRVIEGSHWIASPGRHIFVALWQGRRSDLVEVEVVQTGALVARAEAARGE